MTRHFRAISYCRVPNPITVRRAALFALVLVSCTLAFVASAATASAARPLQTAILDGSIFGRTDVAKGFAEVKRAGVTAMRVTMQWSEVAPLGRNAPPGFNPTDPADLHYRWNAVDARIRGIRANGLEPIVSVWSAPEFAEREHSSTNRAGTRRPDPDEFHKFMLAAARRYSGSFVPLGATAPLPRVKYWQAWNEPNGSYFLTPQFNDNGTPASPQLYRNLLNALASAVHGVDPTNRVVAGGVSPFGRPGAVAPLRFMRLLLCMSTTRPYRSVCANKAEFDIWAQHPYTTGGPTRHAFRADDVSIGDLPSVRSLLTAARRVGHIVDSTGAPKTQVPLWVTEFSWDTKPPDPKGVPATLHARWVSEALYRMWVSGVTLVTWWTIRDRPFPANLFQSGLFRCYRAANCAAIRLDKPKASLRAFRFPFVAFRSGARVGIWGRTPASRPRARIFIERRGTSGWRRVVILRTNRFGIFTGRFRMPYTTKFVRARIPRVDRSLAFSLKRPPDRTVFPFGCGGSVAC